MRLTDQEVTDIIEAALDRRHVVPANRVLYLRQTPWPEPELKPLIDRYLAIKDPPQLCRVEHDHWEGKMICGNPLPCRTHGGGR